jgi:hypothetical protein
MKKIKNYHWCLIIFLIWNIIALITKAKHQHFLSILPLIFALGYYLEDKLKEIQN